MNTLLLLLLTQVSLQTPERPVYELHEPIQLEAAVEVPEGFEVAQYDWSVDKPARGREVQGGKWFHIWAPAGKYEVEVDISLINWDEKKFQKIERVYVITVEGANPPPNPKPNPKPDPDQPDPKPETTGTVYSTVIRIAGKLNYEESTALLEVRDWVETANKDIEHFEFPPDAKNPDGTLNEIVKKYYDRIPEGGKYPYGFIVQEGHILWEGEIESSEQYLKELRKVSG